MPSHAPALLVLEDGRTFRGDSYGAEGETFGEAVFATGMVNYVEYQMSRSLVETLATSGETAP